MSTAILNASECKKGDWLGLSVDLDGARVLVGANGIDYQTPGSGGAYIYDFTRGLAIATDPFPLEAGKNTAFSAKGGDPGTPLIFAYSYHGLGRVPLSGLNVTMNLRFARLGGVIAAESQGSATGNLFIPAAFQGRLLWFQALQPGRVSNLVVTTVE